MSESLSGLHWRNNFKLGTTIYLKIDYQADLSETFSSNTPILLFDAETDSSGLCFELFIGGSVGS